MDKVFFFLTHTIGTSNMTLEEWKKEFRNELDALRKPIERLKALITLCPYTSPRNRPIREIFAQLENEEKDPAVYRIDTDLLETLYQILTHLPKPSSYLDWMKKRYELSELQHFALKDCMEFCSDWGNYYDVHKMEESEKDKVLEDIATQCEHWQKLLESIQNDRDSQQLVLFPTQSPAHVNEKQTLEGLWYTCKPIHLLLNNHPWNQKAKELLDQVYEDQTQYDQTRNGNQQLHIISLMDFGLQSKLSEMVEIRQSDWFSDEIEYKIYGDFPYWTPIQVMHYITAPIDDPECTVNNLPELMEAETIVDGVKELLWHLKEQMTYRAEI